MDKKQRVHADYPLLTFCEYSDSIRQLPQNYCIAYRRNKSRYWICDPDISADNFLANQVFQYITRGYAERHAEPQVIVDSINSDAERFYGN